MAAGPRGSVSAESNSPGVTVQQKLLGKNARRLYAIETVMVVTERIEQYEPAKLLW